jgi:hypothetical protein
MSSGTFDRLARELARPMSRRRALWLAAGALVAIALPGGRATAASSATTRGRLTKEVCGTGGLTCEEQFGADVSECCGEATPGGFSWCCKPGECFRNPETGIGGACCANKCGKNCCFGDEECVDGECTSCPGDRLCGNRCCDDSEVCANAKKSLCCGKTWKQCTAGLAGVVKCCPPKDTCCFNKTTKTATCCDAQHPCVNGRCKCTKDETTCGASACCKKGEVCSRGKCCPKGKVNCGGRCCDKADCCATTCCNGPGRICVNGNCCPGARILGAGSKRARCCPKGTVAGSGPNRNTCCPESDPDCCRDGSVKLTCGPGKTCVGGTCKKL